MLKPSSAKRILVHALRAGLLGCALSLAMITQAGAAESLPASVRACTAETDRERRLDCFDREVARFPDSKATAQGARTQPAAPPITSTGSAVAAAATTSAAPAGQTTAKAPAANAAPATAPATASAANAAPANAPSGTADTAKPGRIAAQLVSIDRAPNAMVLHLDNGQVWEEVQSVAGDLSLKVGDNVHIDKHLGSYWLTGPHVSGMKVRQRS